MASLAIVFIIFLVTFIIVTPLLIFCIIGTWKLYTKMGEKGWKSLIPYYSYYVLTVDMAKLNVWYFIVNIILSVFISFNSIASVILLEVLNVNVVTFGPINLINIMNAFDFLLVAAMYVINYFAYYNISKRLNKNPILYGILCSLIPYIFVPILGISSCELDKDVKVSSNGPIK